MWRFLCHCHFWIFTFCRFISRFIILGVCKAYQKLSEVNGRIANSTMFRLGTSGAQSSSIAVAALQWFPTCQVRVVRFYHSCSRLASPPSSSFLLLLLLLRLLILLVLRLLLCQALRQLFAKLFANVRAQWAPLDLNLGAAQLSEHRWTSTWDRPSSVSAGPQPGTFPAQWAPLDLNLGPAQLSEHRWTSTWNLPSSVSCQKISQIECQKICQVECQKICQIECQRVCQPDRMPEDMSEHMPEDMPDRMPDRIRRYVRRYARTFARRYAR